jgi:hypothetical protein
MLRSPTYLAGSVSCDQFWGGASMPPEDCETAFTGKVADGGDCTIDQDCAGNPASSCDSAGSPGATCQAG